MYRVSSCEGELCVAGSLADSVEALEAVATPRLCHLASWDLVGLVVGIVAGTRASTVVAAAVVSEGALEDVEEDSEAATPDPVAIEMVSALPAALPQDLVDLIEEMAATAISLVGLNPEVDAHMTTDPEMVDETAAEMVVMEAEMEAAMDATEADIGIVTAARTGSNMEPIGRREGGYRDRDYDRPREEDNRKRGYDGGGYEDPRKLRRY
ncbi:unnamed protein product [Clonostachys rosea f. rosea IK726]|uniref:Uncharacterized protein n=1 Tax=Clonostachys rosea f. rosea IK726 TaxID=1349383 RepID=A0ACA9T9K6_BIOOC|nr:unnamed protein product [Clonostachys rosea f. rosea IK726]